MYHNSVCPRTLPLHLVEGVWSVCGECRAGLLDTVREREFQLWCQELFDVWSADILGLLNLHNTENVDRAEAGTMSGSHILIEALDSVST